MCLLVVCFHVVPDIPLVVAANRDERLARPATSITVLQEHDPAILGGRDQVAGGTWLAVNERGVVAGLTNRPATDGRDPNRRSRGELPLLLAAEPSAKAATLAFSTKVDPSSYNPAWLLVGDRESLFYNEFDGRGMRQWRALESGVHVLENRPLQAPSAKVDRARTVLGDPSALVGDALVERLIAVLSDHEIGVEEALAKGVAVPGRPACVHGESYGTRSSTIVLVPEGRERATVLVADGRPCSTPFTDETARWPIAVPTP
jgi:uncharacterized protein with NRDE domain